MKKWLVTLMLSLGVADIGFAQQGDTSVHQNSHGPVLRFKPDDNLGGQLWRVALLSGIVVIGAVIGTYGYKRLGGRLRTQRGKRLRLIESMRLAPKTALFLVQFDDMTVLVGQQGDNLSVLASRSGDTSTKSQE